MKKSSLLASLAAAGLFLLPCALAEEGYVLAVKGKRYDYPVGTKITRETTIDIKEAKMTVTTPKETAGGTMTRRDIRVEVKEVLAPGKIRRITEKNESKGVVKMAEQEQPAPGVPPDPLLGIPVIIEEKDGKITATLEQGSPTPAQEKRLASLSQEKDEQDDDLLRYGEMPRKPGDKWDLDPKLFKSLTGSDESTGTCSMEFLKVEDFAGTPCAVLKMIFDVSGTPPRAKSPLTTSFKGEGIVYRSLAERVDLEAKMDSTMTMEMKPNPQVTIVGSGPSNAVMKTTITKP